MNFNFVQISRITNLFCSISSGKIFESEINKKAKDLEDEEGLNILKEYCPSIYGDGTDVRTCCDTAQLKNMKDNMQVPYSVGLKIRSFSDA